MTSGRPRLPNFLVIGAMKAGTTSLYEYLRVHPQIFMADPKELHYFAEAKNWQCGRDWYEQQFASAGSALAVGEASTSYANDPNHPGVPKRVAELIPDVRLVYLVRHPVDRIESHYRHCASYEDEPRPAEEAVFQDLRRYLSPSRYAHQLQRYLEWFPREQLLVIRSEDLLRRRRKTLRKVFLFLGVDPGHVPNTTDVEYLTSRDRPNMWRRARILRADRRPVTMSASARADLTDRLRADVRLLRELLGPGYGWGIA